MLMLMLSINIDGTVALVEVNSSEPSIAYDPNERAQQRVAVANIQAAFNKLEQNIYEKENE